MNAGHNLDADQRAQLKGHTLCEVAALQGRLETVTAKSNESARICTAVGIPTNCLLVPNLEQPTVQLGM